MKKIFFMFSLLLLSSWQLQARTYQCLNHYTSKKIGPGPIPEFAKQDSLPSGSFHNLKAS